MPRVLGFVDHGACPLTAAHILAVHHAGQVQTLEYPFHTIQQPLHDRNKLLFWGVFGIFVLLFTPCLTCFDFLGFIP